MYLRFFGLTEKPFNITPDPRFLFLSDRHREALAHLLFSTDESSSFVVLTGEVGTGKTTLCRAMLADRIDGVRFALILNPMQTPLELLASACDEFGIDYPDDPGIKTLVDALNRWLLARHADDEQAILIVDEAQNLDIETLEQIRLLTNLETGRQKLLKIVLIGQPELAAMLDQPQLRQLAQRISARYHLTPMNAAETAAYVHHRLEVAGAQRALFTPAALKRLHRAAGGIPRRINLIADRALTGAYGRGRHQVDARLVDQAAREIARGGGASQPRKAGPMLAASLLVILAFGAMMAWWRSAPPPSPASSHTAPAATEPEYLDALEQAAAQARPETTPTDSPIAALLALWRIELDASDPTPACDQADRHGLSCLFVEGSIDDLVALDRPALIEWQSRAGTVQQWLIAAHRGDRFEVFDGTRRHGLDSKRLAEIWPGRFLLLWQPPPSGQPIVTATSAASDIAWLRRRLRRARIAIDDTALDPIENAIRRFQQRHRLRVDGKAGIRTLLTLERQVSDVPVPSLRDDTDVPDTRSPQTL